MGESVRVNGQNPSVACITGVWTWVVGPWAGAVGYGGLSNGAWFEGAGSILW